MGVILDHHMTLPRDLASESQAAVAGGITSFIEMPNTQPQTTTITALTQKFEMAAGRAAANYSFMFGGTNDNLDQILQLIRHRQNNHHYRCLDLEDP